MASLAGMPCMSAPMERRKMEAMDDLLEECGAAPAPKAARVMGKKRAGGKCGFENAPEAAPEQLQEVAEALDRFLKAVEACRTALAAGKIPDGRSLEKARAELLKSLSASPLGPELGKLQRFLRTEAVELVAALGASDAEVRSAAALFDHHAKALEEAVQEAKPRLGAAAPKKPGGKFWEKSV